jgi:transcriptional regulator with XRE-family HTH domain
MVLKRRIPLAETEKKIFIGIGVTRLRDEKGWTREYLAGSCNLTDKALYSIEKNLSSPALTTVYLLAEAFGMEIDEFFTNIKAEIIYKYPPPKS